MNITMNKIIILIMAFFGFTLSAQKTNPWQQQDESKLTNLQKVNRSSFPKKYQILTLDIETFKTQLIGSPIRGQFSGRSNQIIFLPNASGIMERYHVVETPIMEKELADRFPMIKSYAAQGIDDPTAVARFSVTQFGLHSMTFSTEKSTVFIDPYTTDTQNYIVYQKSDLGGDSQSFECLTDESLSLSTLETDRNNSEYSIFNTDDNTLRTYRLAQSCTAEYGNIFAGTGTDAQKKANIQAQMAITMTRVNGVYEIDLGITMIFVINNDLLIYFGDTAADPWSNEWNTKTAQTIDAAIGVNNYDIGHNFNTTGGGNAGCLACVCKSTSQSGTHKGRGYTGRSNPTGDPFDIDYVAHEMGHQFGGYHTQSNSSCRSGSGATEVEPGSASTIMGYAGICPANVQNNSDAYFAYVNIRDIMAYVKTTTGSCSVNTLIANQTPTVDAGLDYVIPKSTPFILTATGSDPDNDPITFCWEQNDPGNPSSNAAPTATRAVGPMFRSLTGTSSPSRYMPNLATILTGATSNTWEVVPSVARDLNFSVIVRDNVAGGGQTKSDLMKVTVSSATGPFIMTSPNTNVSWTAGSNRNVTWTVAGTDANDVNCKFVDIYLSTNGGTTFPVLLASKVPNDGSETVTMPNITGTTNRIMVRGHKQIFFDVSNSNFSLTSGGNTFAVAFDGTVEGQNKAICQGETANYTINYATLGSFSGTTTFSASGNPSGTTVTFNPSSISSSGTVIMGISNTGSVTPGEYQIVVTGTSGGTSKTVNLYLEVLNSTFATLTLTSPANLAFAQLNPVDLQWTADPAATVYDIEVATDIDFTNVIVTQTSATNSYSLPNLTDNTNYFWRVLPKNIQCQGAFSEVFQFTTGQDPCSDFVSTNVPITISASGTPTVNSTLTIPTAQNIIINKATVTLNISHTYLSDLTVTLISPNNTSIILFSGKCGSNNNAVATFDDDGITLTCSGDPSISGTLIPQDALSGLIGENSQGLWTLRVFDNANQDGGSINSWSLKLCEDFTPSELPCGSITSTWNGTSWSNGFPVANVAAIINDDLNISRNMEACSLNINGNAITTLTSGYNLILKDALTVANTASFTVENNANLIQLSENVNSGEVSVNRDTNSLMRLDYTMWSSPVTSAQTLMQFSPETLANRFYTYNTTNNIYTAISDPTTSAFDEAKGYLIRIADNHPTTPTIWSGQFNGVPKNGMIETLLTYDGIGQGFNLIGNPYASTISAEDFLNNNSTDIDGVIYFWRKINNAAGTAYATYTLGGSTTTSPTSPNPNGTIQVGQGFIVSAKNVTTPKAVFTNAIRVDNNNNQFFRRNFGLPYTERSVLERHRIWLNLTNDEDLFCQMMVGYMNNATSSFDEFIDGKYIGDSNTSLTSIIENEKYSIQGKGLPFDATDTIPLNFDASTSGSYTVSIDHVDGLFEESQDIYLKDNLANIVHDLKASDYTFETWGGTFNNRFEIVYQNILGVSDTNFNNQVYVHTTNQQLNIKSTVAMMDKIIVYDMLGRQLSYNSDVNTQDFTCKELLPNNQTLIVKIILENGSSEIRKVIF